MPTIEQEFTEAEIFEGLQIEYEDWHGPGPFSFENIRNRSDATMAMTRQQFNRFTSELNFIRCGICGVLCSENTCENHSDLLDRAAEDNAFDEARKGY